LSASSGDPTQAFQIRSAALELLAEINPTVRGVFERKGLVEIKPTAETVK
jgi:hypothetical protein